MKIKTPPQPLVFRFSGATALCGAVEDIYKLAPGVDSALCRWRGQYFLQVRAGLRMRCPLAKAAGRYGDCLGVCPVLYAFCQEHGEEISRDAVSQLGKALSKGKMRGNPENN